MAAKKTSAPEMTTVIDLSKEPVLFSDSWTVGPDGSFDDVTRERFASELASGRNLKTAAANTGIPFARARLWMYRPEMKKRKRELRAAIPTAATFHYSLHSIVGELMKNAQLARDAKQFKASNEALLAIYNIARENKDTFTSALDIKQEAKVNGTLAADLRAHLYGIKTVEELEEEEAAEADDA
jgi:hypothetical protein